MLKIAAYALLTFFCCFGQSVTGGGTIQGTVKDSTGSAIPKAKVTLTHLESGTALTTESNSDGYFATPPLKIGRYKAHVEASGMKVWESSLELEAGRSVDIEPV